MRSDPILSVRRMAAVALLVALSGCAAVHSFSDKTERENAAANFRTRWVGKTEADVIRRYGSPADTASMPSGHRVLTYHGGGKAQSAAACDLQFEVDDATSIVVRAVVTGSDCHGDL